MAARTRTPAGEQAERERKARDAVEHKKAERERKRAMGLRPMELWGYPEVLDQVKKYAGRLQARAEREKAKG